MKKPKRRGRIGTSGEDSRDKMEEEGRVRRMRGQKLDYVRKLKLIHGCLPSPAKAIKDTAELGEIKKGKLVE